MADRVLKITIKPFGKSGSYIRKSAPNTPITITGVFDEPEKQIDLNAGVPISSTAPSFGVRLADLPGPPVEGDKITIGARTYLVIDVQEDGQGGADLILNEIAS